MDTLTNGPGECSRDFVSRKLTLSNRPPGSLPLFGCFPLGGQRILTPSLRPGPNSMSPSDDSAFQIEGRDEPVLNPAPPSRPPTSVAPKGDQEPPAFPISGWIPLILFLLGTGSVILTQRSVGYAWDESFYYEPARDAADWLTQAFSGQNVFTREKIDLYWSERHEHPSFQKILSGLSLQFFEQRLGPLAAMRLPIAFLFGLSLCLIFLLGRRAWGPAAGLVAALSYLAMPRIFGHAHFASLETPLLFSMLLTVYCFVRGLDSKAWAAATGFSLGLLLATKINGFILIPPLILWGHLYARPRYVNNLFAMVMLAPLVFLALWPWLWPDPIGRVLDYLSFFATHQQTALWFMGRKWGYGDQLAPWFYPSVIIAVTLPISVLFLSILGVVSAAAGAFRRGLPVLFLIVGLVMWALASAPGTPKYDGERLFLPVFPCLALMAGGGAAAVLSLIARFFPDPLRRSARRTRAWAIVALCLIPFAEGLWASSRYYPYLLSYFNPLVGGIAGAEKRGFEVTYWGEQVNDDVLEVINREVPRDGSVALLALHEKCFEHLQRWGKIRPDIRFGGRPPFFAHLLQMRRGFFARPERALAESSLFRPIAEWSCDGVRLLGLYRTGLPFEQYWPLQEPPDSPRTP